MHVSNDHHDKLASERPWNRGKLTGQKPPLQPQQVWAIRTRLQLAKKVRDLALFNIAIDSKLRGCDVVRLKIAEIAPHGRRKAVDQHLSKLDPSECGYLFPGIKTRNSHLTTRQYARLVSQWISSIGLDSSMYGTHSLRRTKATLIYRRTGNLRAVQLLLGHSKIESTVRYLGVEVDDALALAEQLDV